LDKPLDIQSTCAILSAGRFLLGVTDMKFTRNVKAAYNHPQSSIAATAEVQARCELARTALSSVHSQLRAAHEAGKAKAFLSELPVEQIYACAVQAAEYKSISVDRALTLIYALKNR